MHSRLPRPRQSASASWYVAALPSTLDSSGFWPPPVLQIDPKQVPAAVSQHRIDAVPEFSEHDDEPAPPPQLSTLMCEPGPNPPERAADCNSEAV